MGGKQELSGTDALLAALLAVGVGLGDEVITTTYSFFATAEVIARLRALPVFVDIDPATFNLDAQFVVRVPDRDCLQTFLHERGVGTEVYYPLPLHLQKCFAGLGYHEGDFPHAEAAARDSIALPIYPELTAAQQRSVIGQV